MNLISRLATQTLTELSDFPEIGPSYPLAPAHLDGLRYWHVPRFERWLVFYLPGPETIDVVRVLHSARDIPSVLAD